MSSVAQLWRYHSSSWPPLDHTSLPKVGWVLVEFIAPIQGSAFSRHAEGSSCRLTWIFFLVDGPLRRVGAYRSTPTISHPYSLSGNPPLVSAVLE